MCRYTVHKGMMGAMDHQPPPDAALVAYPEASIQDFGPPRGVGDDECAHAWMLVSPDAMGGEPTRAHRAFFKPSEADLAVLASGGYVVVTLLGSGIQPFACGVFGSVG